MKKIISIIMLIAAVGLLSGCIVTDDADRYERKQYQSSEKISKLAVKDLSSDITVQAADTDEIIVDYSDSPTDSWYDFSISNEVLSIEKTRGTVGVEENSLIILLPQQEYQSISIETTNGDIVFDNINSLIYNCSTKNGDIEGILKGKEADYLIVANVKNGKSTLKNNVIESSKIIELNVENGDIEVQLAK